MDFPKDRDGFSNRGNKDARALTGLDVPFLTRRRLPGVLQPGTIAKKRGDFLEVRLVDVPVAAIVRSPFLWSILFRLGTSVNELRYRRYGWGARTTLNSVEQLRNPAYVALGREWYAGGGYVLQHCAQAQPDALDQWPTWLSLIALADTTGAEVLSLWEDNKPGRNVSFYDRTPRLPTNARFWSDTVDNGRPHAFATGWDALAKGYGFGAIGRTVNTSTQVVQPLTAARDGVDASIDDQYAMAAWWGDTAARTLQRVELRGDTYRCSPAFVLHSVRPGCAMAFVTRYRTLTPAPNPESEQVYASGHDLGLLRTDDHGRSWSMEEVPEVKALLLRDNAGALALDGLTYGRTIPGLGFTVIAPLDTTGRLGAILRISRTPGANIAPGDVPPDWPGPADRWSGQHFQTWNTRKAFLVSDTTGRNWVRKAWPLDAVPANIDAIFYDSSANPFGAWLAFLSTAQVHNPAHSAGAGSFFVARFEVLHEDGKDRNDCQHRARMVYTTDAGDTWAESALLPDALANDNVRRVIWPIVAKPFVSLDSPGEIYLVAPTPARVRIYRTDAVFSAFTEVYDQAVADLYLSGQGQSDLNALFIGDASGEYPPRMRPGFPEFDKP